ncbi:hypothetical protein PHET_05282 [Paragonimus heterotremus]|uniref:SCP domain-containing protein n=1 Tax=Paragonimus heterotremus TaxID=100268 RepID=A0A8J4TL02_9TREM|nr:hypothetical protein PHET_05282 [Paragonimus heterotremus]
MSKWTILLCILFAAEGEITQLERERTLCILNEIRREFLNCFPSKSALSTKLKWNLTLEYYANVHSRHLCMEDRNIPGAYDLNKYKDLTFMEAELDKYDYFYRELWNARAYYTGIGTASIHERFITFALGDQTKEVGCDHYFCRGTTNILCFYDFPNKPSWNREARYQYCNDSTRLIAHAECNAGSTRNRASGLVNIFGSQLLLFLFMSAITINEA